MSDLLTREEYKAIAAGLTLPVQAFVDGSFRPAQSGKTLDSVNPATGAVLAQVAACGAEDVDFAVQKAWDAFEDGRWSRLHPGQRKQVLIRLAKLMKRNARELRVIESLDSGKTLRLRDRGRARDDPLPDLARGTDRQDLRLGLSGLERSHRAGCPRTRGGRRPRAALELSPADAGLEDRPGAGGGLFGDRETG
ncbi:hypothetical protein KU6B_39740 [Mameliella alba]|uniref:aldehyde dehydrogenase family protein n=1 Tax=Mameliella alba TaxID=561184 RepID=UPI0013E50275|nr:aldehyde dehydrogenase family protein [Mameliella alba]BBU57709.1 hypothetical protein KU6B_39740 [Mameliella alba]